MQCRAFQRDSFQHGAFQRRIFLEQHNDKVRLAKYYFYVVGLLQSFMHHLFFIRSCSLDCCENLSYFRHW